jgi:hypothetical protein
MQPSQRDPAIERAVSQSLATVTTPDPAARVTGQRIMNLLTQARLATCPLEGVAEGVERFGRVIDDVPAKIASELFGPCLRLRVDGWRERGADRRIGRIRSRLARNRFRQATPVQLAM